MAESERVIKQVIETSPYTNTRTKVSARCSTCGHHWTVVPHPPFKMRLEDLKCP